MQEAAPKPVRSMDEVQQDYNVTCGKLGDLRYRIYLHDEVKQKMESDYELLCSRLKEINQEGVEAQKLVKQAEVVEAPKVVVPDEVLPPA